MQFVLAFTLVSLHTLAILALTSSENYKYVAVIDAGSTGSRMYVYRWFPGDIHRNFVPNMEKIDAKKSEKGLSEYADDTENIGKNHLAPLVNFAKGKVPKAQQGDTPVYLMATAGLRLVQRRKRNEMFTAIRAFFNDREESPFKYKRENIRILSGEEEGVFMWITVNYLNEFLTNPKSQYMDSHGILEMGGASTQIAFIPTGQILADKYPVRIGSRDYSLYVHSYLYYGADYADIRVKEILKARNSKETQVDNPCMLKDDKQTREFDDKTITFNGKPDAGKCEDIIEEFMYKVKDDRCHPFPCTIGNVYQPPVGSSKFYAVGVFYYTPKGLNGIIENDKLDVSGLPAKADNFCKKSVEKAKEFNGLGKWALTTCVKGLYIPILLETGLRFPKNTEKIYAVDDINDKSLSWTIGAALYEISRKCQSGSSLGAMTSSVATVLICKKLLTISIIVLISFTIGDKSK